MGSGAAATACWYSVPGSLRSRRSPDQTARRSPEPDARSFRRSGSPSSTPSCSGVAPPTAEWTASVESFESASRCSAGSLADMGRDLAGSDEFAASYPEQTTARQGATLHRRHPGHAFARPAPGRLERALRPVSRGRGLVAAGRSTRCTASSQFEEVLVPAICDRLEPAYGFGTEGDDYEPPLDLRELSGDGASRTQQQLQDAIDAAGAAGGGTVELAPGELIRIGGAENGDRQLVIAPGVTLTTAARAGARGSTRAWVAWYRTGRTRRSASRRSAATSRWCASRPAADSRTSGSKGQASTLPRSRLRRSRAVGARTRSPTRLVGNRVSVPARDGVGIRARGFSLSGEPCTAEIIADNLVTGYASAQSFDARGQAMWSDGIAVGCESARVTGNQLIDISDAGIVLYGAFNRALASMRAQTSSVSGNQLLSAGLPGHVALGFDAIGECSAFPSGGVVPCLDVPTERDFHGVVDLGQHVLDRAAYPFRHRAHGRRRRPLGHAPRAGDRSVGIRQHDRAGRRTRQHRNRGAGDGRRDPLEQHRCTRTGGRESALEVGQVPAGGDHGRVDGVAKPDDHAERGH